MTKKDIIMVKDFGSDFESVIDDSIRFKENPNYAGKPLADKAFAMIFEKPSTRTRISFETAIFQLGGHPIYLNPNDMQLSRGETIHDTAHVLSRFVDGIIYRAFDYKNVEELAKHSSIPVINALDNREHPCQIVADFMTIKEKKGALKGINFTYIGDGNNMCNSLMIGASMVGMNISIATPKDYAPSAEYVKNAKKIAEKTGSRISILTDPKEAVKNADFIYTDVWVSMGDEKEKEKREKVFKPYQINMDLLGKAPKDVMVMHCLPAHRGYEITDEVVDSKHSIVFDEAENRMHSSKGILNYLMRFSK
ncbi:MAG: ornithine carbamoyltransferase [Thermoplasmata archaeon]